MEEHPQRAKMDLERLSIFKEVFSGAKDQNIEAFFERFESWCNNHDHDNRYKVRNFVCCLDGPACTCYKSLPRTVKENYLLLKEQLLTYYAPPDYSGRGVRAIDGPQNEKGGYSPNVLQYYHGKDG